MDLNALLDRVNSKEAFLEFVAALQDDWEAERVEEQTKPSSPYGPGGAWLGKWRLWSFS